VNPEQREARHQADLDRIFELGQQLAATWPPLTDEQIEHCAFIIAPKLAPMRAQAPAVLPRAA
jgi:hypothetical protein